MRAILLLLSSLVVVLSLFIGGMAVSTYVLAEPEPHHFAHLDSPEFWTVQPVAIDPKAQHYERIAAKPAPVDVAASDLPADAVLRETAALAGTDKADGEGGNDAANTVAVQAASGARDNDPAHVDWCMSRYRSYRMEDNSYQPFSGGPRRACQSPYIGSDQTADASSVKTVQTASAQSPDVQQISASPMDAAGAQAMSMNGTERVEASNTLSSHSHTDWCMERYRSYRADDDTYQPFDGGPRRQCESPFG